jgi:hypothetical protein
MLTDLQDAVGTYRGFKDKKVPWFYEDRCGQITMREMFVTNASEGTLATIGAEWD